MKTIPKDFGQVRNARTLVVTGSGISADSGIPTFRGEGGYWRNLDPTKLATATAFRSDPELVWQWYRERRQLIRRSQPNVAHQALVKLAAHSRDYLLITQNVDDLHARAEWEDRRLLGNQIVQIHGDIFITRCSRCDFARRDIDEDAEGVPQCPKCDGPMRPGVIWFDEELDPREVQRIETYLRQGPCETVLVIGTTATFDYIIRWARSAVGAHGKIIEVNPKQSAISQFAKEVVREPAALAVPRIVEQLIDHFEGRGPRVR